MSEASYKILTAKGSELAPSYEGMLLDQFMNDLRNGNQFFRFIDRPVFYSIYKPYIRSLLSRPEATVRLAVLSDDLDVVLGWSLTEPKKLHFVRVHPDNRGLGIAKSLVQEPVEQFSHITLMGLKIWKKKFKNAKFNPFC